MTPEMTRRTMDEIIRPTVRGMAARGTPFKGVLFARRDDHQATAPSSIEYNVRFGDPECQVLMLRLKSDLLPALIATADGVLETFDLRWHDDAALTVVMAAKGYPGDYAKGTRDPRPRCRARRARASRSSTPARAARATGCSPPAAACSTSRRAARPSPRRKARAYEAIAKIDWPGGFCRTDIGWRAIAREKERA